MGEEIRKKAMEGLVSSECDTFFCMILTNMPFGLQIHFTESTSTSGSGSKRGEYSYHDTGCPAIWLLNILFEKQSMPLVTSKDLLPL